MTNVIGLIGRLNVEFKEITKLFLCNYIAIVFSC